MGFWTKAKRFISNLTIAILVLVIVLLAFFLAQSRMTKTTPSIGGYQMYIVLSGSMLPTIEIGSLAIVKEVDPLEVQTGDVITFRGSSGDKKPTTHRVARVEEGPPRLFWTKGDANRVEDPMPVEPRRVIGRMVLHIPYAGYVLTYTKENPGVLALLALPPVLLLLWDAWKHYDKKKKGSDPPDGGSEPPPDE